MCFFLPKVNMNQPQVYIYPLSLETPSHPPPHSTPLGCHGTLDLSSLHQTANFHWLSNFTCGNVYISGLLSQFTPPSPSYCIHQSLLCLHLHCCPADRFISTVFLDSVYIHQIIFKLKKLKLKLDSLEIRVWRPRYQLFLAILPL